MRTGLGNSLHGLNYSVRSQGSAGEHLGIEATFTWFLGKPLLDAAPIRVESFAGFARVSEFDKHLPGAELLPALPGTMIETASGEIFTEGAVKQGPPFCAEGFDDLRCQQQQCFLGAAVQAETVRIAYDAERIDFGFGDGRFRDPARGRDIDLQDSA